MQFSSFSSLAAVFFACLLASACYLPAEANSVVVREEGLLEIVLNDGDLVFEINAQICSGEVLVCFESDAKSLISSSQCESKCGLSVSADEHLIAFFGNSKKPKAGYPHRLWVPMIDGQTNVSDAERPESVVERAQTCKPKVKAGGLVKLNVKEISSQCSISIINASVKEVVTTTPSNPGPQRPLVPAEAGTAAADQTTAQSSSFLSFLARNWWWLFLIWYAACIIVGTVISVRLIRADKKRLLENRLAYETEQQRIEREEGERDPYYVPPSRRLQILPPMFAENDGLPRCMWDV